MYCIVWATIRQPGKKKASREKKKKKEANKEDVGEFPCDLGGQV